MRKIVQALNHPEIFIDDVGYVKNGEIDAPHVRQTNLYKIIATMIKKGNVYTTTPQVGTVITELDFPPLVSDGGKFIKYEE